MVNIQDLGGPRGHHRDSIFQSYGGCFRRVRGGEGRTARKTVRMAEGGTPWRNPHGQGQRKPSEGVAVACRGRSPSTNAVLLFLGLPSQTWKSLLPKRQPTDRKPPGRLSQARPQQQTQEVGQRHRLQGTDTNNVTGLMLGTQHRPWKRAFSCSSRLN